jgi:NAD(P)-dependent dehydrogenase (short-subunit alcohol dehydrogenase family)
MNGKRFAGRSALVTGGGSGIGRAVAHRLAADGATVAILDRSREAATSVALEIEKAGGNALPLAADVTDAREVDAAVGAAISGLGGLHILVTSAGLSRAVKLLDMTPEVWNLVLGVNLTGTFLCTRAVAPHLTAQGRGRIVMIGSTCAQRGFSYRSAYCASKGGVISLMQAAAVELAEHGVTVNAVSPGPVESPMTKVNHTPAIRAAIAQATPIRRYGQPEEVAASVAFLASDEAAYVTGQEFSVDGGFGAAGIMYRD